MKTILSVFSPVGVDRAPGFCQELLPGDQAQDSQQPEAVSTVA